MARKFLTAIDLTQLELQNAKIQNLAAAPSTPVKGQIYMNSTDNTLYWYDGAVWVAAKAGSSIAFGSVPAETTFGIAKADGVAATAARSDHTHGSPAHSAAEHSTIPLSALAAATANVSMGGFKITTLAVPTAGSDAATKQYVDAAIEGLTWKNPVKAATTAAITMTGVQSIDGVTTVVDDRILVKNQADATTNGIYRVSATAWTRALDADNGPELNNAALYVSQGTTQGDTAWVQTVDNPIVGVTSLTFVQFSGSGTVTAGAGMTQAGNVLNVIGDATITVAADQISRAALTGDVTAAAGANATTIANDAVTTLKIINDAVDNTKLSNMAQARVKGRAAGAGTGDPTDLTNADLVAILGNLVPGRFYGQSCSAALTTVLNHNFNKKTVVVGVYRSTTPFDEVECDIERTDFNNVTVRFAVAPTAGEYEIVVFG